MENLQENENYKLGFEAGQKASIERFKKLKEICTDDIELLEKIFIEDTDLGEVAEKRIKKLTDTNVGLAWNICVAEYRRNHNCSEAEAVSKCVDLYPELHKKMSRS